MPRLDWIGKKSVVNHHREVPFHLLRENSEKHFFPQIGNLRGEGEEFDCAFFLATQLVGVESWIHNVECKRTSFSLQTGSDRFYPDFLCKLENGKVLAVEYKNKRDWHLPENIEKRRLGELWEKRSTGQCLFIMPEGKDFAAISAKVQTAF